MTTNALPQINRVVSSQISEVGYDSESRTLYLRFVSNGALYAYQNVSEDLYGQLMGAPSIGSFFFAAIKNNPAAYPYTRIE